MNIRWPMTSDTFHAYRRACNDMLVAAHDDNLLSYEQAKDKLRSLPGFPHGCHEDDRVVPVIDDTPTPMSMTKLLKKETIQ